jgi:trehalose 6-phosphate phosphatase
VAVFLDYDGTLTPIVSNPDAAVMSDDMRDVVRRLARLFPTAIVSGRGREKVEQFVQLQELYYAGSHGMDIVGPRGASSAGGYGEGLAFQPAAQYEPLMQAVCRELGAAVAPIPGAAVENNKFCLSVHYRNVDPQAHRAVAAAVEEVVARHGVLRITRGRKVLEVRPQVDWDKGAALVHLLGMLGLGAGEVFCLYLGDDRTDEDAFTVLADRGLGGGVLVSTRAKPTRGRWTLRDPEEVADFLGRLVAWGESGERWGAGGGGEGSGGSVEPALWGAGARCRVAAWHLGPCVWRRDVAWRGLQL